MRTVFLDNVKKYNNHGYCWETAINQKISFIYDDIVGEMRVVDYDKRLQKLTIEYNCRIFTIHTSSFLKARFAKIVCRYKQRTNYNYRIGDSINGYIVLEQYRGDGSIKKYKVQCRTCGAIIEKREYDLRKKCPVCIGHKVVEEINSCKITNPQLFDLIIDKDIAIKETQWSHKKVSWGCPTCGHVNKAQITHLFHERCGCKFCDDGCSYPEKVLYNAFTFLSNSFETQKRFSWSRGRIYDLFDDGIFVEIHGEQHYRNAFKRGRTLQEERRNDDLKRELAINNGGCADYIIIDASRSEFEFIRDKIMQSRLNHFYDLSKINWEIVRFRSSISRIKECVDLFNKGVSIKEISIATHNCLSTVYRYLHRGNDIGICNFVPNKNNIANSKSVCCQ